MSWGRSWGPAVLLGVAGPWLAGCGSGSAQDASPTPVMIPGSSVTIGTEPGGQVTREPTELPATTDPAVPTEPTVPTETTAPAPTGDDLVARVGGAMGGFDTVRVAVSDATSAPRLTIDLDYASGALAAQVAATEALPAFTVRRVEGSTYVDAGPGFVEVPADQLGQDTTGLLAPLVAFDLLGDLKAVLVGSTDLTALGETEVEGIAVEQLGLTVDAAALAQPSLLAPGTSAGPVQVVLAVTAGGLPVRLDVQLPDGTTARLGLSGYGDPVDVAVPPTG